MSARDAALRDDAPRTEAGSPSLHQRLTATRQLSTELARLKVERGQWERRIALLKSNGVDPDMLDERARALLDYAHPHDLTMMLAEPPHRGP